MDSLSDLPLNNDTVKTPEEQAIMQQFFPGSNSTLDDDDDDDTGSSSSSGVDWKLVGYATGLFVILANPWIDRLLCLIPYCGENSVMLFIIKGLLFLLLMIIISRFL